MAHELFTSENIVSSEELPENGEISLLEEQLVVDKRIVETAVVRLHKRVEELTQTLEVPLTQTHWHVERVPLNIVVAEQPEVRKEDETTIYPVVEERVTVIREFVLLEEVRVTRKAVTTTQVSEHLLRKEHLITERVPIDKLAEG